MLTVFLPTVHIDLSRQMCWGGVIIKSLFFTFLILFQHHEQVRFSTQNKTHSWTETGFTACLWKSKLGWNWCSCLYSVDSGSMQARQSSLCGDQSCDPRGLVMLPPFHVFQHHVAWTWPSYLCCWHSMGIEMTRNNTIRGIKCPSSPAS